MQVTVRDWYRRRDGRDDKNERDAENRVEGFVEILDDDDDDDDDDDADGSPSRRARARAERDACVCVRTVDCERKA